jgi:hypothetical protein
LEKAGYGMLCRLQVDFSLGEKQRIMTTDGKDIMVRFDVKSNLILWNCERAVKKDNIYFFLKG